MFSDAVQKKLVVDDKARKGYDKSRNLKELI